MSSTLYKMMPKPPAELSAPAVIARMIDGLAFRYRWSLEGLDNSYLGYRPSEDSRSLEDLLKHVHFLCARLHACFVEDTRLKVLKSEISEIPEETLQLLKQTRDHLLTMNDSSLVARKLNLMGAGKEYPFWFFINGPLADALTHVGQINAWRRLAGSPTPRANVFLGKPPSR
jgi:hypothetical protein